MNSCILPAYELLVLACTAGFAAYDLRTRRVPDRALLLFCPIALMAPFLHAWAGRSIPGARTLMPAVSPAFPFPLLPSALLSSLAGAAISFLILLAAAMASENGCGIGGGDIKLAAVIGFIHGPSRMTAILLTASGLAAIAALIMNHKKKRTGLRNPLSLPFVPFLAAGSLAAMAIAAVP